MKRSMASQTRGKLIWSLFRTLILTKVENSMNAKRRRDLQRFHIYAIAIVRTEQMQDAKNCSKPMHGEKLYKLIKMHHEDLQRINKLAII